MQQETRCLGNDTQKAARAYTYNKNCCVWYAERIYMHSVEETLEDYNFLCSVVGCGMAERRRRVVSDAWTKVCLRDGIKEVKLKRVSLCGTGTHLHYKRDIFMS